MQAENNETRADEQGHNGWKNYETWAVALWLDNDHGSYVMVREWADECRGMELTGGREAVLDLADMLKTEVEDGSPLNDTATPYTDLLSAAMSEVDWLDIAENILSE